VRLGPAALRGALADEAERALDALLAGPWPEAAVRSAKRHDVVRRVAGEALEAGERDPFEVAVERALASPAFELALRRALSSPEVRAAFVEQGSGFGRDLAESLRAPAAEADARIGTASSRVAGYGGLASRGAALVIDGLIAYLAVLAAGVSVALVAWLAGAARPGWVEGALAGSGGLLLAAVYFTAFWSSTGQTPGMRLFGLRVVAGGATPGVGHSLLRFAGLAVSILTLGLGFLPVLFDRRRRALQDFLAGTEVVR
jgi:uncharacterized RDD family membrane protein YckC